MTKKCASCGIEKDISEFHRNAKNRDGLHSYCKTCNVLKAKEFNKTPEGKNNVNKAQKKQFDSGYFRYGKGAIQNMSRSASNRGIEFHLTEKTLKKWWEDTKDECYYCRLTIQNYRMIRDFIISYKGDDWEILRFKRFFNQDIHSKINDMTIDRTNNSLGYELNNIVKSCWICNSLKSDFFTEDEMKVVGKDIMHHLLDKT